MRIIVDATSNVLMWSENGQPAPDVGQTAIDLSADQQTAFRAIIGMARNGMTFDGKNFTALPAPILLPPPILTVDQKLALFGLTITDIQGAIVEAQTKNPVPIPDPNTAPIVPV